MSRSQALARSLSHPRSSGKAAARSFSGSSNSRSYSGPAGFALPRGENRPRLPAVPRFSEVLEALGTWRSPDPQALRALGIRGSQGPRSSRGPRRSSDPGLPADSRGPGSPEGPGIFVVRLLGDGAVLVVRSLGKGNVLIVRDLGKGNILVIRSLRKGNVLPLRIGPGRMTPPGGETGAAPARAARAASTMVAPSRTAPYRRPSGVTGQVDSAGSVRRGLVAPSSASGAQKATRPQVSRVSTRKSEGSSGLGRAAPPVTGGDQEVVARG